MYTFHGFCKAVIRNAAITAWRRQHDRADTRNLLCNLPITIHIKSDQYKKNGAHRKMPTLRIEM